MILVLYLFFHLFFWRSTLSFRWDLDLSPVLTECGRSITLSVCILSCTEEGCSVSGMLRTKLSPLGILGDPCGSGTDNKVWIGGKKDEEHNCFLHHQCSGLSFGAPSTWASTAMWCPGNSRMTPACPWHAVSVTFKVLFCSVEAAKSKCNECALILNS